MKLKLDRRYVMLSVLCLFTFIKFAVEKLAV